MCKNDKALVVLATICRNLAHNFHRTYCWFCFGTFPANRPSNWDVQPHSKRTLRDMQSTLLLPHSKSTQVDMGHIDQLSGLKTCQLDIEDKWERPSEHKILVNSLSRWSHPPFPCHSLLESLTFHFDRPCTRQRRREEARRQKKCLDDKIVGILSMHWRPCCPLEAWSRGRPGILCKMTFLIGFGMFQWDKLCTGSVPATSDIDRLCRVRTLYYPCPQQMTQQDTARRFSVQLSKSSRGHKEGTAFDRTHWNILPLHTAGKAPLPLRCTGPAGKEGCNLRCQFCLGPQFPCQAGRAGMKSGLMHSYTSPCRICRIAPCQRLAPQIRENKACTALAR